METLFGKDIIKSIGFDEGEILKNIHELHAPNWFEIDPCYSIGSFYKRFGIPEPKHKFDINPQAKSVLQSSAETLPFDSETINSIMFDPPFLADQRNDDNKVGIITDRFSSFKNIKELWDWYYLCLVEYKRILKRGGVLVFKCQDTVSSGKNYFSHCHILNMAVNVGLYPKDLFILLAKNRIIGHNHEIQKHARKFHCYYWVFTNEESKVDYTF